MVSVPHTAEAANFLKIVISVDRFVIARRSETGRKGRGGTPIRRNHPDRNVGGPRGGGPTTATSSPGPDRLDLDLVGSNLAIMIRLASGVS